jgi:hypothetical protein
MSHCPGPGFRSLTIFCKVEVDEILLNLAEKEVEALPSIPVKSAGMVC